MNILVTGAAGFIGYFLCEALLAEGYAVHGIDNLNDYYDPALKRARVELLRRRRNFAFTCLDIADASGLEALFAAGRFTRVAQLAAQAGVRYSLENPGAYVQSNLEGFVNMLEACRRHPVEHLVFASSSSVYGLNAKIPFSAADAADHPVSLYAASKRSGELLAHAYSHLYNIPCTGLRFFTVYGPWGRPDMAYFSFTRRILSGEPITLYNHGKMRRDFTYISDIVSGLCACLRRPPLPGGAALTPDSSAAPFRLYNIGNNKSVELEYFVRVLEDALGRRARVEFLPMQPGDVPSTFADISGLERDFGFRPRVSIEEGLPRFAAWYKEYYAKLS